MKDVAHETKCSQERRQKVLQRCAYNQNIALSPFALGRALLDCWDTGWMSPTCMSLRRHGSDFIVQFHVCQLNRAGRFYLSLGGWGHILATWHTLWLCWYFRISFLSCWAAWKSVLPFWIEVNLLHYFLFPLALSVLFLLSFFFPFLFSLHR